MGTNIQIPIDKAGIGDAIAIKNNTTGEDKSHFICVVGSTVSATAPSGYTWYGTVYGREKGGLMVQAITYFVKKWASSTDVGQEVNITSTSHPNVNATTEMSGGLQRNGLVGSTPRFLCMSVQIMKEQFGDSTSTEIHPTCANSNDTTNANKSPMSLTTFNRDVNNAKTLYGTYENYLAQMLPIMKGSKSGVFSKRCGKQNTKELATINSTNGFSFPAAKSCYDHVVAGESPNHWWLPDMYELAVMLSDSSYERWMYAHGVLGGRNGLAYNRYSSVRYSNKEAWCFWYYGHSYPIGNSYEITVCPVTLIAL